MPRFVSADGPRKTMTSLTFVLLCLAVWRITHMIVREEGPFSIFQKMREPFAGQSTWIGRGLHCMFCVSYWLSAIAAVFAQNIRDGVLYWHAVAGGVFVLYKVLK